MANPILLTALRASVQDTKEGKLWLSQDVQWSKKEEHLTQHSFFSSNPSESSQGDVVSMQQPQLTTMSEVPMVAVYPHKYRTVKKVHHHSPTPLSHHLTAKQKTNHGVLY